MPEIGQIISHYRITKQLGQGGMGEVFLADDLSLGRKVALKFLTQDLQRDPAAHKRLLLEARSAAALDHPYICHINEVGESGGRDFIVMEYVAGENLKDRLVRGALPWKEALQTATEIAEALEEAHGKGIIHRDLKPANIMITATGHAKVMDFGLAKQLIPSEAGDAQETTLSGITGKGAILGTLAYMSPEQARAKNADARSDIFSFGIMLYQMLTGNHPFQKETDFETVSAILSEDPPPLDRHVSGAPELLQHVLGRMLAKEPEQRYQSMHEVRADMNRLLQLDESVITPTPRRIRAILVVVAFVILAAGAGWWLQQRYLRSPGATLAFQERNWILITDFENLTGEPVFEGALETAMTVSIQQSRYVNVFPRARVLETLKQMRKEGVKRLDENLGCEVALRERIKGLLVCSINKIGDNYLLAARLVDPNTQLAVYSQTSQALGGDRILAALDVLAEKVRHELGESLNRISNERVPLLRATTASLEALKSFTEARLASDDAAIGLLKHAVELDPDFALAQADLGFQYCIVGDRQAGELHFKKALSLLDRLTVREQLWIRALVEDWRGNREQAVEYYRTYLAKYPDDMTGWFRLGYVYQVTNRPVPAIEAFKKVIELSPSDAPAFIDLASCYALMGKNDDALASYERAFQLNPADITGQFVNHEYGFLLVQMGMIQRARETFEKMLATNDAGKRARGRRSLALLNMYQGKYAAAKEHLREAILMNKASETKLSEMRDHLFLASVFQTKGAVGDFGREMSEVRRLQKEINVEPYFLYLTGRMYARMGQAREASQLLQELSARLGDVEAASGLDRSDRDDQACHNLLQGELELLQKRYQQALDLFGIAATIDEETSQEPLAYGYLRSGNLDEAARQYKKVLEIRSLGFERQEPWILTHYQLGRIYEQKGQPEKAVEYYQRFLNIWKEADEDLIPLQEAKDRLAALKRSSSND
jgi:serine/threonine protein kinase/tetratricopeptide (TPR) repeat protein